MDGFIPDGPTKAEPVPNFENARSEDGWQGQGTTKSLDRLKAELMEAITRAGGMVTAFTPGAWGEPPFQRPGYRIKFALERDGGAMHPGQLDIAALPCKQPDRASKKGGVTNKEASLRMALYMARNAFDGLWFLRQLSPGFVPLLSWLLDDRTGKTLTQLYGMAGNFAHLLPAGDADFVEGEIVHD